MKNNFVVYTALFGDYDDLIDPKENYEGCDFICFTDQKDLRSDIWQIKLIDNMDLLPNIMNRKYKILPHLFLSDYNSSMYIDANIAITKNPLDLKNKYLEKNNFCMPKHFERDCIYQEAKECVILDKSKYRETKKQMEEYKKHKFPKNYGLGENNILLRKHNDQKIVKLMNEWWNELNKYTKRDQLSLGYILWKNNKQFNFMKETARNNSDYFKYILHNSYKNRKIRDKVIDKLLLNIKKIYYKNLIP